MNLLLCLTVYSVITYQNGIASRYEPNWKSLDSRPLPGWYDEGKVGIFLHWGVFSVPAFGHMSSWLWWYWKSQKSPQHIQYMKDNYPPDFTYADFAPAFKAEFYDPNQWADIFEKAGASYVVLVTKHHEGFTNWPSKYSWNWNAGDLGPKRDLVGDLAKAIRSKTKIKFGLYHSLFEFFNPLYLEDKANGFRTQTFVRDKTMPELYELVNRYKPEVIWSDGDWLASDTYWNSTEFLAWLYNDSPVKDTVVVNDRWGNNTRCKHGGFWSCEDQYRPGKLVPHKWENCMIIDRYSWAYRSDAKAHEILTIEELLEELVTTISFGGNILMNVGPTSKGEITPIFQERLLQLGAWLKVNGEAIYKTHVWSHQNDSVTKDAWYTARNNGSSQIVYAILLSWPHTGKVTLGFPQISVSTSISLIGYSGGPLKHKPGPKGGVVVSMPEVPLNQLTSKWAWVLKMKGLKNQKTQLNWNSFAQKVESIRMQRDLY